MSDYYSHVAMYEKNSPKESINRGLKYKYEIKYGHVTYPSHSMSYPLYLKPT